MMAVVGGVTDYYTEVANRWRTIGRMDVGQADGGRWTEGWPERGEGFVKRKHDYIFFMQVVKAHFDIDWITGVCKEKCH